VGWRTRSGPLCAICRGCKRRRIGSSISSRRQGRDGTRPSSVRTAVTVVDQGLLPFQT
jgi:hypothetical protein